MSEYRLVTWVLFYWGNVLKKLITIILLCLFAGCGGGSHGSNSGDITIRGLVVTPLGIRIPDARVIDLESGNETISDSEGTFKLLAALSESSEINILIEALGVSSEVSFAPSEGEIVFVVDSDSQSVVIAAEIADGNTSAPSDSVVDPIKDSKTNEPGPTTKKPDSDDDSTSFEPPPTTDDDAGNDPLAEPTPPPEFSTAPPPPPTWSTSTPPPSASADVPPPSSDSVLADSDVPSPEADEVPTDDQL